MNKVAAIKLVLVFFILVGLVAAYHFSNIFYQIVFFCDKETVYSLNGTLNWNKYWVFFWGYLNHFYETYLNIIPITAIIILALKLSKVGLKDGMLKFFYYIITLELVLYFSKEIFDYIRLSPSYYFNDFVSIIKLLGNENLKCTSHHSFPSGHSLAYFYFFFYIKTFKIDRLTLISLALAIFFSIPRVISGAHWVSDILYAVLLAYFFNLLFYQLIPTPILKHFIVKKHQG